jgi:ABC-type sugar transport system permease subunit
VLKGGLLSIPTDTLEAAAIDGASWWSTTRRVVLPQMRSTIMTLALLIIFFGFAGSFAFIDVMTAGGPGTATVTLPFFGYVDSFTTFQFGDGAALALMSMAFVLLLSLGVIRLSKETWRS